MQCPMCGSQRDRVIDSRIRDDGRMIRRQRECCDCSHRWVTVEQMVETEGGATYRPQTMEAADRIRRAVLKLSDNGRRVVTMVVKGQLAIEKMGTAQQSVQISEKTTKVLAEAESRAKAARRS